MSYDYSGIASTAAAQIADKGRNITYTSVGIGTFNPATGSYTGETETDTTLKAVFTEFLENQIDGSVIKRGDKQVLITDVTPKINDKITDGSDIYQVVNIKEIKPGDTACLYKLQVRR